MNNKYKNGGTGGTIGQDLAHHLPHQKVLGTPSIWGWALRGYGGWITPGILWGWALQGRGLGTPDGWGWALQGSQGCSALAHSKDAEGWALRGSLQGYSALLGWVLDTEGLGLGSRHSGFWGDHAETGRRVLACLKIEQPHRGWETNQFRAQAETPQRHAPCRRMTNAMPSQGLSRMQCFCRCWQMCRDLGLPIFLFGNHFGRPVWRSDHAEPGRQKESPTLAELLVWIAGQTATGEQYVPRFGLHRWHGVGHPSAGRPYLKIFSYFCVFARAGVFLLGVCCSCACHARGTDVFVFRLLLKMLTTPRVLGSSLNLYTLGHDLWGPAVT